MAVRSASRKPPGRSQRLFITASVARSADLRSSTRYVTAGLLTRQGSRWSFERSAAACRVPIRRRRSPPRRVEGPAASRTWPTASNTRSRAGLPSRTTSAPSIRRIPVRPRTPCTAGRDRARRRRSRDPARPSGTAGIRPVPQPVRRQLHGLVLPGHARLPEHLRFDERERPLHRRDGALNDTSTNRPVSRAGIAARARRSVGAHHHRLRPFVGSHDPSVAAPTPAVNDRDGGVPEECAEQWQSGCSANL